MSVTYDPLSSSMLTAADRAYSLGYLGSSKPNLNGIYDLGTAEPGTLYEGLATIAGP